MKLSDLSDEQWYQRLSARRNQNLQTIRDRWAYYDGTQPLYHVAKILAEQDDRFPALTINWCRKYIRSIDGRSTLEGFGYVGKDSLDDRMQQIMLRNELDLLQSLNNTATMVTAWSYGMVGPSDEGAVITIESPESVAVEVDPVTQEVVASLKVWAPDIEKPTEERAVMMLPDSRGGARVIELEVGKIVSSSGRQEWTAGPGQRQGSGLIPVVPFLNQPRYGVPTTQLADLIPIVDAANFVATSLMATVVHHAAPRMLAINVLESLFLNEDGTINREAVKAATGSLWIVPAETDEDGNVPENAPEPDIKAIPASDLRNFHDTLSHLARIGTGLCDLQPSDFGFGIADNPPSAESINAQKAERLLAIERFNRQQGAGYEKLMRYALAVEGSDPGKRLIEAKFRNVATPTKQSMADAAVKTLQVGISDIFQARVDYGYTPTQIKDMEARERTLARDPFRIADGQSTETDNVDVDVTEGDNAAADAAAAGE